MVRNIFWQNIDDVYKQELEKNRKQNSLISMADEIEALTGRPQNEIREEAKKYEASDPIVYRPAESSGPKRTPFRKWNGNKKPKADVLPMPPKEQMMSIDPKFLMSMPPKETPAPKKNAPFDPFASWETALAGGAVWAGAYGLGKVIEKLRGTSNGPKIIQEPDIKPGASGGTPGKPPVTPDPQPRNPKRSRTTQELADVLTANNPIVHNERLIDTVTMDAIWAGNDLVTNPKYHNDAIKASNDPKLSTINSHPMKKMNLESSAQWLNAYKGYYNQAMAYKNRGMNITPVSFEDFVKLQSQRMSPTLQGLNRGIYADAEKMKTVDANSNYIKNAHAANDGAKLAQQMQFVPAGPKDYINPVRLSSMPSELKLSSPKLKKL